MTKITVDVPENMERKAKLLNLELSLILKMAIKKVISDLEEINEIERIAFKSQATEKDVEDLSDEINRAVAEHYSRYK